MAHLLLLDNDERIVELLSWFLGERGFSVGVAHSFAEARERLAEGRPDLLISDVDLGTESAVDELPRLSVEGILPPTLVVSGYLDAAVRAAIMAVPEVLDTLAKPFEFPHLEEKVRSCLAGESPGRDVDPGADRGADRETDRETDPEAAPAVAVPLEQAPHGPQPAVFPGEPAAAAPPSGDLGVGSEADDDDDDGWVEITGP